MKVLKIGAEWCKGCTVMKPRWKELEEAFPWLQTQYYEFDDHPEIIEQYSISKDAMPAFIFLDKEGNEFQRVTGEPEKDELEKIITENKDR